MLESYLASVSAGDPSMIVPAGFEVAFEPMLRHEPSEPSSWRTYYLHRAVELDGAAIADASVAIDKETSRPSVLVTFDADGKQRFAALTAANLGGKLAILVDGAVMTAPLVQTTVTGGRVTIGLAGDDLEKAQAEASALAVALAAGVLPGRLLLETMIELGPPRAAAAGALSR